MTAQRYRPGVAHERMEKGHCPECGKSPDQHYDRGNFWDPWMASCDLLRRGVEERIAQYEEDKVTT